MVQVKLREEAERAAALEVERKAKEAADKLATEASERVARAVAQQEAVGLHTDGSLANLSSQSEKIQSNQAKKSESASMCNLLYCGNCFLVFSNMIYLPCVV